MTQLATCESFLYPHKILTIKVHYLRTVSWHLQWGLHSTAASSWWVQSVVLGSWVQSSSEFSVPTQATLSRKMGPVPWPKEELNKPVLSVCIRQTNRRWYISWQCLSKSTLTLHIYWELNTHLLELHIKCTSRCFLSTTLLRSMSSRVLNITQLYIAMSR